MARLMLKGDHKIDLDWGAFDHAHHVSHAIIGCVVVSLISFIAVLVVFYCEALFMCLEV